MGDANPIRTLGDYSKPSHEGYRNTIELPVGNNLGKNAHVFISISLCDQASNWLERLPTGSIIIWEDLTTRFLAQFFLPGRTAKLRNDILMFQQDQGESISEASQMNFTSTNDPIRDELEGKGIKSPSKLLSLKYLSQSSLAEQNRNPSSPKRVHFVNSIVILNKEDEATKEENVKTSTTEYEDHEITVESEEEFKEETKDEIKEEEEDSPKHFDTFPTMKELRH
nr:hypothetical protein [Tanacetum cinerariifolium]